MTAKEFLLQYEYADRRARRLRAEYEREQELIDAIRSPQGGDGMPRGSGISKTVEDRAIRLTMKLADWKEAELDAIRIRQEVFEVISGIDGIEGEVLYERYINLHKWEDICVLVHMSWRHTHRIHAKALRATEQKMALNDTMPAIYD